jgi:hypothetical protein
MSENPDRRRVMQLSLATVAAFVASSTVHEATANEVHKHVSRQASSPEPPAG